MEAKVSVEGQATLAECGWELDVTRAELQRLITSAEEASIALLLPPLLEGGHDLTEWVCSLIVDDASYLSDKGGYRILGLLHLLV